MLTHEVALKAVIMEIYGWVVFFFHMSYSMKHLNNPSLCIPMIQMRVKIWKLDKIKKPRERDFIFTEHWYTTQYHAASFHKRERMKKEGESFNHNV